MGEITAWAFENKNDEGRFLSDGPEFADYEHERGDVTDLVDALLVWMRDGSEPTEKELAEFENEMNKMKFFNWQEDMRPHYNAVKVSIPLETIQEIEGRG